MSVVSLDEKTEALITKTVEVTGMSVRRILIDAVSAYCQRKIKLANKKEAVECANAQQDNGQERVLSVVNLYLRICCPPLPPVCAKDVKASSAIGKKILAVQADYDWERHFRAAVADEWLRKQPWINFGWIVGKGFSKVAFRADNIAVKNKNNEGKNENAWEPSF